MLGPNLLVASVFEEGARTRRVYLPSSTNWYDFYSGEYQRGGQTIQVDAPLERIPLLVRAGGILPFGKAIKYVGAEPDDVRQVLVFPHRGDGRGEFTLIEDDGVSLNYQRGEYAQVRLVIESQSDAMALRVQVSGNYRLPYNRIEFVLPRGETRRINARGDSFVDEQGRKHLVVEIN
jgi:alpha-glucosidase